MRRSFGSRTGSWEAERGLGLGSGGDWVGWGGDGTEVSGEVEAEGAQRPDLRPEDGLPRRPERPAVRRRQDVPAAPCPRHRGQVVTAGAGPEAREAVADVRDKTVEVAPGDHAVLEDPVGSPLPEDVQVHPPLVDVVPAPVVDVEDDQVAVPPGVGGGVLGDGDVAGRPLAARVAEDHEVGVEELAEDERVVPDASPEVETRPV